MTGDSVIVRKPSDLPDETPEAWADPKEALPHVVRQMRMWFLTMRSLEAELDMLRALLDDGQDVAVTRLEAIAARLNELNHAVGNRLAAWVLVVDELRCQAATRKGRPKPEKGPRA